MFLPTDFFGLEQSSHALQSALELKKNDIQDISNLPLVNTAVNLGEICVFMMDEGWKVGKTLQFSKIKCKSVSGRQYKGSSAEIRDDIGVLCSWFGNVQGCSENLFQISDCQNTAHSFIPLSSYLCTITSNCMLSSSQEDSRENSGIMPVLPSQKEMSTMKYLELTEDCKKFISDLISLEQQQVSENEIWVKIHHTHLYLSDKATLLDKAECLNDNHMACAQLLLRQAFPALSGLESTLVQQTGLRPLPQNSLQILLVNENHWVATSTVNCPPEVDILFYDSIYSTVSEQTKILLAELVHTNKPEFSIGFANVSKQSGSKDCGLFSVAYIANRYSFWTGSIFSSL